MADYVPTFTNDISPMFAQYRNRMTWRIDLCKYEDVLENAPLIYSRMTDPDDPMPPANQGSLSSEQIALFKTWMDQTPPLK